MSAMPARTCQVMGSPNTVQPITTAVSGSSAPSTATMVLPMRLTLNTRQVLVTKVQIMARAARWVNCEVVVMGLKLP